jgi:hypothetical protein
MPLKFESISLEQQKDYLNLLNVCPQKASDYSFANLWGWAQEYGLLWAWEDRLVWIRQTQPEDVLWAPVGPWDKIDWKQEIVKHIGQGASFIRVPEKLTTIWRMHLSIPIGIEESRDQWDYLYTVPELVELKGKRFHKKKNLLNQFAKKYPFAYAPLGSDFIDQALAMQTDWCTWRDCESVEALAAENRAIQRVLTNWIDLSGLTGGMLNVDGHMVAYTIAERLTKDMVLIHFEKANPDLKGGYQAINQLFLAHNEENYKIVNREQDLGNENLRKAKLAYHPVDFLRKYKITLL